MKLTYQRMFDYGSLMAKYPNLSRLETMDYDLEVFRIPRIFKSTIDHVINNGKVGYMEPGGMERLKDEIFLHESLLNDGINTKEYSVFVGNGVSEILYTIIKAILLLPENKKRKEVILFSPGYSLFESIVYVLDGNPKFIHGIRKNDFVPTMDCFEGAVTKNTAAIVFANPHNPTAISYSKEFLRRLIEVAKQHNIFLVSDEIYADMLKPPYRHISTASVNHGFSNLAKVFGLSKDRPGMTGLRIGYCITDRKLANTIRNEYLTRNFTINAISEYLLLVDLSLRDKRLSDKENEILKWFSEDEINEYFVTVEKNYERIFSYQKKLCQLLDKASKIVDFINPHGCNMIFFKYYKNLSPEKMFHEFAKKGVGIYGGDVFHVDEKAVGSWSRICITRKLDQLIDAVNKIAN